MLDFHSADGHKCVAKKKSMLLRKCWMCKEATLCKKVYHFSIKCDHILTLLHPAKEVWCAGSTFLLCVFSGNQQTCYWKPQHWNGSWKLLKDNPSSGFWSVVDSGKNVGYCQPYPLSMTRVQVLFIPGKLSVICPTCRLKPTADEGRLLTHLKVRSPKPHKKFSFLSGNMLQWKLVF